MEGINEDDRLNEEEEHTANTALCTLCSRAGALISEINRLKVCAPDFFAVFSYLENQNSLFICYKFILYFTELSDDTTPKVGQLVKLFVSRLPLSCSPSSLLPISVSRTACPSSSTQSRALSLQASSSTLSTSRCFEIYRSHRQGDRPS